MKDVAEHGATQRLEDELKQKVERERERKKLFQLS
jgi:hypothetical protein